MEEQFDLMENITKLNRMLRRKPKGEKSRHSRGMHKVLRLLLENDGMCATDLAKAMDIRPSSLTDVLKRLEEQEYIYKAKDESDSRSYQIHVTKKAKEEFDCRIEQRNEQAERLKTCITQEEMEAFCRISNKMISFLETEYPENLTDEERGSNGRRGRCQHKKGHQDGEPHRHESHHGERHHSERHHRDGRHHTTSGDET